MTTCITYTTLPPIFLLTPTLHREILSFRPRPILVSLFGWIIRFDELAINYLKNIDKSNLVEFCECFDSFHKFISNPRNVRERKTSIPHQATKHLTSYPFKARYSVTGKVIGDVHPNELYSLIEESRNRMDNRQKNITSKDTKKMNVRNLDETKEAKSRHKFGQNRESAKNADTSADKFDRDNSSQFEKSSTKSNECDNGDKESQNHNTWDANDYEPINLENPMLSIDLSTKQYNGYAREIHVPVSRNNYDGIRTKIARGNARGYVITGPTGCGKSTVALLPLFAEKKTRVILVEPTQANVANIIHEFVNILPNMVKQGVISGNVPKCGFIAPTVSSPPFPDLAVTTTEKLLEYFYEFGKLPSIDYLIVDEFHLPIPSMVKTVEFLRIFDFDCKYVLVSATAQGFSVSPQLPKAVTHRIGSLPLGKLPNNIARTELDPRSFCNVGDGTYAVVAPSEAVAKKLHRQYKDWNLKSALITRNTVVSKYLKATTSYSPGNIYVLEPGVEAGVTLSISVLVSMGTTTAIRYDGKVVFEDSRPLDEIASIQRGGRGGRVRPTLYITPKATEFSQQSSTADYYRAQAVIYAIAFGAVPDKLDLGTLDSQFPKLRSLTLHLARKAISTPGDPFITMYQTSANGEKYAECGGTGSGFDQLAAKELYVYYYDTGFFVSPIADFTDTNSIPDSFVIRSCQFEAAISIVESIPGLTAKYSFLDLVKLLEKNIQKYVKDLFVEFKSIFAADEPTGYYCGSDRGAEIEDFTKPSPPLTRLFKFLKTQPVGVRYLRIEEGAGNKPMCKHSFSYKEHTLNFALDKRYNEPGRPTINVSMLSDDLMKVLRGILCIEMLLSGASHKCVNLNTYKNIVPEEHVWFTKHVRGREPF